MVVHRRPRQDQSNFWNFGFDESLSTLLGTVFSLTNRQRNTTGMNQPTRVVRGYQHRLKEYWQMGARFAKWRAVIAVGDGIPSRGCIEANAQALARYAALCQEVGLWSLSSSRK